MVTLSQSSGGIAILNSTRMSFVKHKSNILGLLVGTMTT